MLTEAQRIIAQHCTDVWKGFVTDNQRIRKKHTTDWRGLTIRPAEPSDIPHIMTLAKEVSACYHSEKEIRKMVYNTPSNLKTYGTGIYVLTNDKNIIGTCNLTPSSDVLEDFKNEFEVQGLCIATDWDDDIVDKNMISYMLDKHFAKCPNSQPFARIESDFVENTRLANALGFKIVKKQVANPPSIEDGVNEASYPIFVDYYQTNLDSFIQSQLEGHVDNPLLEEQLAHEIALQTSLSDSHS